jgi:hypothetical protein
MLKRFNNRKQLRIVRFVASFRPYHFPREICDRVPAAFVVLLARYPCDYEPRSIGFDPNRLIRVEVCEDRRARKAPLQFLEGLSSL